MRTSAGRRKTKSKEKLVFDKEVDKEGKEKLGRYDRRNFRIQPRGGHFPLS